MSSTFGNKIKISIFGESHGPKVGAVVDGLPAGFEIDMKEMSRFMKRRAPGADFTTKRKEDDVVNITSGLFNGRTCDAPLCIEIENNDVKNEDYSVKMVTPRPGHADYTAFVHSGGFDDFRGGGHNSGRLTAPMCAAGNVLMQILEKKYGICFYARLFSVGKEKDEFVDWNNFTQWENYFKKIKNGGFPVISSVSEENIKNLIKDICQEGNSVGGSVECFITNIPAGTGEPMFEGLENVISQAIFAIPGVKAIEFGDGFEASEKKGYEENDAFTVKDGKIGTFSNHSGGILGGRANGMTLRFRVAFKPTPSVAIRQNSVNMEKMADEKIEIKGRHDPCIAFRAVPCVEAAAALAVAQFLI